MKLVLFKVNKKKQLQQNLEYFKINDKIFALTHSTLLYLLYFIVWSYEIT